MHAFLITHFSAKRCQYVVEHPALLPCAVYSIDHPQGPTGCGIDARLTLAFTILCMVTNLASIMFSKIYEHLEVISNMDLVHTLTPYMRAPYV